MVELHHLTLTVLRSHVIGGSKKWCWAHTFINEICYLTAMVLECWDEKKKWFSYLTAKVLKDWYENIETFSYLTAIMLKSVKEMDFLLDSNCVDGSSDDHQHRDEYLERVDCVTTPTHLHKGLSFESLHLFIILVFHQLLSKENWLNSWPQLFLCIVMICLRLLLPWSLYFLHYCNFFTKQMSALATRTSSLLALSQCSSLWNL